MTKKGATARWTVSTGASLVLMVAVALVAAPVVSAGPGDGGGGGDPIAGLIGDGGPGFLGGGGDQGGMGGGQEAHGRAMSRGETDSYGLGFGARGEGDQTHGRLFFGHRGESGDEGFAGDITCLSVGDDGVVQVSGTTREGRGHNHRGGRHGDGGGKKEGDPGAGGEEGEEGEEGAPAEPAEPAQPAGFGHGGGHHGGDPGKDDPGKDEGSKDGSGDEKMAGARDFAFTILTKSDPQQFSLPKMGDAGTLAPCGGGDATTVAVTRGGFRAHK